MVVKNEGPVITRALSSLKPFISYWVIVDIGSLDDTKNLIRESLKEIPGELHEKTGEHVTDNRNLALELARGKADYILFVDANDWLEYAPTFAFPNLTADIYWAKWQAHETPGFSCMKPLMIKDSFICHWEGLTYEYLACNQARSSVCLEGIRSIFSREGSLFQDPLKYANLLEQELEKDPHNARNVFYLAESYRDANCSEQALAMYQKRTGMGEWPEEVFWSLLQIGHLKKKLGFSYEEIFVSYLQAHHVNIFRSEPIYYMAELNNETGHYKLAYEGIQRWYRLPKLRKQNPLFEMEWIDAYGLAFQHSIAAFYMHKHQESLDLHDQLLKIVEIPQRVRNQVLINREFPLKATRSNIP